MNELNPFDWHRPLHDPDKIIEHHDFAREVALKLKSGAHIALVGPRDTGKTSFIYTLERELALIHGDDAPPYQLLLAGLTQALFLSE